MLELMPIYHIDNTVVTRVVLEGLAENELIGFIIIVW